eukprot:364508-Chlamydomonas_euryale.AAC.11
MSTGQPYPLTPWQPQQQQQERQHHHQGGGPPLPPPPLPFLPGYDLLGSRGTFGRPCSAAADRRCKRGTTASRTGRAGQPAPWDLGEPPNRLLAYGWTLKRASAGARAPCGATHCEANRSRAPLRVGAVCGRIVGGFLPKSVEPAWSPMQARACRSPSRPRAGEPADADADIQKRHPGGARRGALCCVGAGR